jgi:hypothetical protein
MILVMSKRAIPTPKNGEDVNIAPGPDGILALAVASLAGVPPSQRQLLTRKLGERER